MPNFVFPKTSFYIVLISLMHDQLCISGSLQKPQISISPVSEVNWGDRVEITCTIVTEHMGGTFILKMIQGSFKMERFSDNEATTFAFPAVDFNQKGSYFCEYQKKLAGQVIYYPQGNTAELSVVGQSFFPLNIILWSRAVSFCQFLQIGHSVLHFDCKTM